MRETLSGYILAVSKVGLRKQFIGKLGNGMMSKTKFEGVNVGSFQIHDYEITCPQTIYAGMFGEDTAKKETSFIQQTQSVNNPINRTFVQTSLKMNSRMKMRSRTSLKAKIKMRLRTSVKMKLRRKMRSGIRRKARRHIE